MDRRVSETYAKDSKATLLNKLSDPYVKAIRWASDRIGADGIVAFVTNNSFIDQIAFDGVRKNLAQDFDAVYTIDLGGNVRKNPKLSGTTHNVFGIQVGVSINIFVRKRNNEN
jgi:predicted helicase